MCCYTGRAKRRVKLKPEVRVKLRPESRVKLRTKMLHMFVPVV